MAGVGHTSPEFVVKAILGTIRGNKSMGGKRETRGSHLGDCYGQRGLGVARRRDGADDGALLKFGGDWDSVTAGREQSGGL
jgi:hypothetical protein